MIIRREVPGDVAVVGEIHAAAFAGYAEPGAAPVEPRLVEELRADRDAVPELSLVALDDARVVGHVMCSRATLDPSGLRAVGLGPIGVWPDLQRSGVGKALMHAVIGAADAMGLPCIGLLGDPGYYRRFGFVTSTDHGVVPPDPAWGAHFQVRTLSGWQQPAGAQTFRYAPAFERL